ncbi:uncharacterized protein LOC131056154 isoform X2 [Cryptomeria japonica]|uniref:uncharacterized protein LOC131056154 isoform X2 n=1 Tax=Cryptomeria japonica TaxID=3369 RepID=UPI0025AD7FA7|nr:uncharacterized protein LOC131056154 isoform X2 [Cryptomeria japonica]
MERSVPQRYSGAERAWTVEMRANPRRSLILGEEQRGELQWLIGVVAKKKLKLLWPLLVLSCPFADICYHPQPCSVVLSEREKGVPLLEGLTVGRFTQSRDYKSIEKSSSWQGRIESKDKQVAKEQMKVEGLTVGRFTQSRDYKSIEKSSSWQGRIESKDKQVEKEQMRNHLYFELCTGRWLDFDEIRKMDLHIT